MGHVTRSSKPQIQFSTGPTQGGAPKRPNKVPRPSRTKQLLSSATTSDSGSVFEPEAVQRAKNPKVERYHGTADAFRADALAKGLTELQPKGLADRGTLVTSMFSDAYDSELHFRIKEARIDQVGAREVMLLLGPGLRICIPHTHSAKALFFALPDSTS